MSSLPNSVVIVGAGEMGRSTLTHLIRHLPATRFRVIDRDAANLEKAKALSPAQVSLELADYNTQPPTLEDAALVANFAGPFFTGSDSLARLAVSEGCSYFDICDDVEGIHPILALDGEARSAGVALVTGGGNSPGTSNLMAKRLLELDPEVDGIRIVWVTGDSDPGGLAPLRHMLHMATAPCPIWQDGRFIEVPGFVPSTAQTHTLPVLGEVVVYNTAHSETVTLPRALPQLRHVSVQGAIYPEWASEAFSTIGRLGFGYSDLRVDIGGQAIDPVEVLWKVLWARHDRRSAKRNGFCVQQVQALKGNSITATMSFADSDNMARTTGISAASQILAMLDDRPPAGSWGTEVLHAERTLDRFTVLAVEVGAVADGFLLEKTSIKESVK